MGSCLDHWSHVYITVETLGDEARVWGRHLIHNAVRVVRTLTPTVKHET